MKRVLVLGASGTIGRQVLFQLHTRGVYVRALTRYPETTRLPASVDVVQGDLSVPESLDAPLQQMDAVFLVWTAPPDTVTPVLERMAKQVQQIVFLSSPHQTAHPFFQKPQPNPAAVLHHHIEQAIENSGLEWTFLRPGMFAANALHWWAPQIRAGHVVQWPYLAAPTAPIDERDVASVAVRALCEHGHAGADYVLTGPESLSQREQLSIIGRVIGRSLSVEEISPEQARKQLFRFWPTPVTDMLLTAWAAAIGQPAFVTSHVMGITGAPARTYFEWVTDHAAEFQA
jgi:uncharacterized protein YbjT (DUF2867 family)